MAVRYPDIGDPMIPELIPNQRLIDLRKQFGVPGEFLLDDYNEYYTNMNDNQPIEKIGDGVSPDLKEYSMASVGNGEGGGITELLQSQDGAIGYVKPLDSIDGITSLQNSMTGSFDITPVTKEEFAKNDKLNSRFKDYNDYFQQTIADGQFSFPKEKTGILQNIKDGGSKFLDFIKKGGVIGNLASGILPEQRPESIFMRNYYGGKDGSNLTSSGSIASGLMKGYNPVSGGGLYTLTGGRYGEEPTYGLQNAYDRRMDTIRDMLTDKYSGISADMTDDELQKYMSTPEGMKALRLNVPGHSTAIERYFKLKEEKAREAATLQQRQNEQRIARETRQRAEAAQKGQNYTGDSDRQNVVDRNTGRRDATGGDRGSRGASDRFENKSGRGRTGY